MLDAGRLVEQGTHAELLAKAGLYASLWNRQRQAEKAREELAEALAQEGERIKDGRLDAGRPCRGQPRLPVPARAQAMTWRRRAEPRGRGRRGVHLAGAGHDFARRNMHDEGIDDGRDELRPKIDGSAGGAA